jgi:hypothetical protein
MQAVPVQVVNGTIGESVASKDAQYVSRHRSLTPAVPLI